MTTMPDTAAKAIPPIYKAVNKHKGMEKILDNDILNIEVNAE